MNIIEALVVTLSLNADNFKKGSKEAQDDLEKTRKQAEKTAADTAHAFDKQATAALTKFKNEALAITGVLLGASGIKDWINSVSKANIQTGNAARNLGTTASDLNAWKSAARSAGGEANDVESMFKSMSSSLEAFRVQGTIEGPVKGLFSLGLSATDARGKILSTEEALMQLSEKASKLTPLDQAYLLNDKMGFGPGVNPLMAKGRQGVFDLVTIMHRLGDVSGDSAESSKRLNAELVKLDVSFNKLSSSVEHLLEGPISKFLGEVNDGLQELDRKLKSPEKISKVEKMAPGTASTGNKSLDEMLHGTWLGYLLMGDDAYRPRIANSKNGEVVPMAAPSKANDATPAIGSANLNMQPVRQELAGFGWTEQQITGIVANLLHESSLNPAAVGDGGKAYGIAQWHPNRQADFKAWLGRDIVGSSLHEQVAFLNHELTAGKEKSIGDRIRRKSIGSDEVAALFSMFYERPKEKVNEAVARATTAHHLTYGSQMTRALEQKPSQNISHSETHVGPITIHTSATDAKGLVNGLNDEVKRRLIVAQGGGGAR